MLKVVTLQLGKCLKIVFLEPICMVHNYLIRHLYSLGNLNLSSKEHQSIVLKKEQFCQYIGIDYH